MRKFFAVSKMLFLSIILNILIVTTAFILVSMVCAYFGISIQDSPFTFYLIFYSIIGFGGAFISLQMSRAMAKRAFGVKLLDESSTAGQKLIPLVRKLSKTAGLSSTPEVGIFESPEVNAFATGPSAKRSLVAVSTGLLNSMNEDEVEGVLAHEVAHIANGDMVTMALIQGMVNTMVLILARLAVVAVSSYIRRRSFWMEYMLFIFFQMIFNFLGSILVVNVFSRWREYKADKGGAKLAGREKMIAALEKLSLITSKSPAMNPETAAYNTFKIQTGREKTSFFAQMFSTHPPLSLRIQRLKQQTLF